MELRRATLGAAVRLATALSVIAVIVTLVLDSASDVSRTTLVTMVAVVGFVTSWIQTSRAYRTVESRHRIAYVPVRQPAG
jgi:hypothetical protein